MNDTDVPAIRAGAVALQPTPGYRLGFVSLAAAVIGFTAGLIAFVLYNLIGLFTNLAFYHEWSFHFRSPEGNHLGPWVIVMPVVGGLIVGVMRKYGSDKIRPRHPRSDGGSAEIQQPHRGEGGDSETTFGCDCHRHRRTVWR